MNDDVEGLKLAHLLAVLIGLAFVWAGLQWQVDDIRDRLDDLESKVIFIDRPSK